jgi:zinc transporter ZupT
MPVPNLLLLLFLLDLFGTLGGVYLMRLPKVSRVILPATGGVMLGVAFFWIMPDMADESGLAITVGSALSCFVALLVIDRNVLPICPCCTHSKCGDRQTSLVPLALGILIHNAFDGWTAAVSGGMTKHAAAGLATGILTHKVPEALVFGIMIRTAAGNKQRALVAALVTSIGVVFGGIVQPLSTELDIRGILSLSLALACGSFLFVGTHTFLRHHKEAGTVPALAAVCSGLIVSMATQWLVR